MTDTQGTMMTGRAAAAFILFMSAAAPAAAVTLNVDGTGQLLGADGVEVSGEFYNVEFVDGSCAELFSGCDDISDFDLGPAFTSAAAALALLDQVFLDGPLGNFDSDTETIRGCSSIYSCPVIVPEPIFSGQNHLYSLAYNGSNELEAQFNSFDKVNPPAYQPITDSTADGEGNSAFVFARFTLAGGTTEVPAPGALGLLGVALAGLGAARRRKA